MSKQPSSGLHESESNQDHITTIRFSLPTNIADVQRLRLIGRDILLYVPENKVDSVTKSMIDHGFNTVERIYKLHISAASKADFDSVFGEIEYEDRSSGGRFIATIIADTEEDYNKYLAFGQGENPKCRVKAFRARFANIQHEEPKKEIKQHINQSQNKTENWQVAKKKSYVVKKERKSKK